VVLGIIFDVVGVAVTSADEKPFHSMAARKVPGAQESIRLLRNAERVSSICNDVVGDICGVVSGSASATIAAQILSNFEFSWPQIISLIMSALVAGLTVGGKAVGKTFAMNSSTVIVHTVGKISYNLGHMGRLFPKKKK
jgi:CBS domain containing-hemolysin-like protein